MKNSVEEIKTRLNVVDVIQEYTRLKQLGTNWKGLCPFHREKTPSFTVSEDKQVWHCFGCGEGGDLFSFIEKIENVDFVEALRILAQKANVELEQFDKKQVSERNSLLELMKITQDFYQRQLFSQAGVEAREYLKERGLNKETVLDWHIGYVADTWSSVLDHLKKKGFSESEIIKAGLALKHETRGSVYDRFRGRVMFPIVDQHGQTVGFTGRILKKDDQSAKYVNSPQTILFDKSEIVFGLYQAKKAIKDNGFAILVEGQMDVISAYQADTKNVIASSGTALTVAQLVKIKRYTTQITVAYDSDAAGAKALERSIHLALGEGFGVSVIILPSGDDPDSLIRRDRSAWHTAVKNRVGYVEYYFEKIQNDFDLQDVSGKKSAAKIILPILAALSDNVEQDAYIQRLAALLGVDVSVLRQSLQPSKKTIHTHETVSEKQSTQQMTTAGTERELRLLAILCMDRKNVPVVDAILIPEDLSGEIYQTLYKSILFFYNQTNISSPMSSREWASQLFQHLDEQHPQFRQEVQVLQLLSDDIATSGIDTYRDAQTIASILKRSILQQHILALRQQFASHPEDSDAILTHISESTKQLKNLSINGSNE